jgi:hypothetical protein
MAYIAVHPGDKLVARIPDEAVSRSINRLKRSRNGKLVQPFEPMNGAAVPPSS